MKVAAVSKPFSQDFGGFDHLILSPNAARGDPGAEKQALDCAGVMQSHEGLRHFLRFERSPAIIPAGAERAVKAVALAGRGQEGFEQLHALTAGQDSVADHP
jgi:hypothetical protein